LNYAIPILLLVVTIGAFFAIGRGTYASFGVFQLLLRILAALPLLASGVLLHLLRINATAGIIPPAFPARPFLVLLTGLLEIAGAIALFFPTLRRPAAFWIAIMMVAIFPANIYAAGKTVNGLHMPGIPLRTSMQIVYILLVLLAGYGLPGRRSLRATTESI
jgi:uncharacterized membrane protein